MAKIEAVWGIDLGNSSLKAVRCRPSNQADEIIADAFDYIEYPKILTQPGAEPEQLLRDALAQFQARNSVRGTRVAISVSGQSGLARFIKLPPVEAKRIPDIVKYEARQQIPFALQDVIWDYQQIAGGMEVEGFVLEAEVGIFAMKRDQVFRVLEPLRAVGIDVDYVQLAPLALYNFLVFDQLTDLPPPEEYDPEDPPPSWIVLSMGTDATDLVISNGFRVWQRSIPLGGNHFTKALTKELKLTFAKAEHLKRNASAAQDPKAVFQAMRPVFSDLLTEIQRSINYFSSIDRSAKIARILTLGNAMKLPGLQRYLGQNLGYEVVRLDMFRGLIGPEVVNAPAFKENLLSFPGAYGLALQALGRSALKTNLLPKEILQDRLIRQKKPWAVAAAAVLMLGCTISFASLSSAMAKMDESVYGPSVKQAEGVVSQSQTLKSAFEAEKKKFDETNVTGQHVVGIVKGRLRWLELLRALSACLPSDPPTQRPEDISLRNELHVTSIKCYQLDDVGVWFAAREKYYTPPEKPGETPVGPAATPSQNAADGDGADPGATAGADAVAGTGAADTGLAAPPGLTGGATATGTGGSGAGPTGPGWVFVLNGFHYHNRGTAADPTGASFLQGAAFVHETLIKNLEGLGDKIALPDSDKPGELKLVSIKDLGVGYPVLVNPGRIVPDKIPNPKAEGALQMVGPGGEMAPGYGSAYPGAGEMYNPAAGMATMPGAMPTMPGAMPTMPGTTVRGGTPGAKPDDTNKEKPFIELYRFDFQVEFCWQPDMPGEESAAAQTPAPAAAPATAPGEET